MRSKVTGAAGEELDLGMPSAIRGVFFFPQAKNTRQDAREHAAKQEVTAETEMTIVMTFTVLSGCGRRTPQSNIIVYYRGRRAPQSLASYVISSQVARINIAMCNRGFSRVGYHSTTVNRGRRAPHSLVGWLMRY